jgi:hypothetical protein
MKTTKGKKYQHFCSENSIRFCLFCRNAHNAKATHKVESADMYPPHEHFVAEPLICSVEEAFHHVASSQEISDIKVNLVVVITINDNTFYHFTMGKLNNVIPIEASASAFGFEPKTFQLAGHYCSKQN